MIECASLKIGQHYLGGNVGENPTALFGTIFFEGQDLIIDSEKGLFDDQKARKQIHISSKTCQELAVPLFLDVVAETEQAISKEIEFVVKEFDTPFLIDASDEDVRMRGVEIVSRLSALDRAVYNSIGVDSPDEELKLIERFQPAAIVVSAIDTSNYGVESALETVNTVKERLSSDLHHKMLLDIGFLDEVSVKMSCKIGQELRKLTGIPVGGAPCNGLHMWESLKTRGEMGFIASLASTLGYCTAFGLDFLFAGPLRHINFVATAQGVADVYNRYSLMINDRTQAFDTDHPIKAMFKTG